MTQKSSTFLRRLFLLGLTVAFSASCRVALACTAFTVKTASAHVDCKRFDYFDNAGLVLTNLRDNAKEAVRHVDFVGRPAGWVSVYGSLTFSGFGRDFPGGGINEKGLGVESLRVSGSVFPPERDNGLPYINNRQWVQYILDQASTVAEAIKLAEGIRVQDVFAQTHLFITDAAGEAAVIEYVNGELVATTGEALKSKVITNDTWEKSSSQLKQPISVDPQQDTRFVRVAAAMRGLLPVRGMVNWAFEQLSSVSLGAQFLSWFIVYDIKNLADIRVHFNSTQNQQIKSVKMSRLHFEKDATPVMFDIQNSLSDPTGKAIDITEQFIPYTKEADARIIDASSVVSIGENKYKGMRDAIKNFNSGSSIGPVSSCRSALRR